MPPLDDDGGRARRQRDSVVLLIVCIGIAAIMLVMLYLAGALRPSTS